MMITPPAPVGVLLKTWRQRRRVSQLALALAADISARHLSFVETGRARPSRDVVKQLAHELRIPPREQNSLLIAAGHAPEYPERPLADESFSHVRGVVDSILRGHEPYPAMAIDRHWQVLAANRALGPLTEGVADHLLTPPANVLRASLHPAGLAPRILNLAEWRAHVFDRLQGQIRDTGDPQLQVLLHELRSWQADPPDDHEAPIGGDARIAVTLQIRSSRGVLRFLTSTLVFGTPVDLTLAELAIEIFLPADSETAARLQAWSRPET